MIKVKKVDISKIKLDTWYHLTMDVSFKRALLPNRGDRVQDVAIVVDTGSHTYMQWDQFIARARPVTFCEPITDDLTLTLLEATMPIEI